MDGPGEAILECTGPAVCEADLWRQHPQAEALALEDTAPRFPVIPPGALHGRAGQDNAWMMSPPRSALWAMMRPDLVAHQMHRAETPLNRDLSGVENGHACSLPLAVITVPVTLASTKAAQRGRAPARLSSCATSLGRW
jgi:hypothetical protein